MCAMIMFASCHHRRCEQYRIDNISVIDSTRFQDYWEKHMGIVNNRHQFIYTYEIELSNDNHDTVITTQKQILIDPKQCIGATISIPK